MVYVIVILSLLVLVGCSDDESSTSETPTFDDVAPLLTKHCNSCHTAGGIAPFALTTPAEARLHAAAIKEAVSERTMPPWGVDDSGDCQSYTDSRWLDDADIDAIVAWIDAGGLDGLVMRAEAPLRAPLESATHRAEMSTPYTPPTGSDDVYRCFVLDPGVAEDAYLTAYQIIPGEPRIVHHVILYALNNQEAEDEALARDLDDADPGYGCFGGPGVSFGNVRFLAGWAPGTGITRYPEGTGIRVKARHKMVMQVHYNLVEGALPDRTAIEFELAESVASVAEVLPLVNLEFVLPPGQANAVAENEILVEDTATQILGVYPHMHTRGVDMRVERARSSDNSCVVDVPRWDFNWQQFYFYESAIDVAPGDIFKLRCSFDTRGASGDITWGEGTADEMCLAGFYLTPPVLGD